ncbi:MAG: YceI family protein [Bacteroidales bacterium]
MKSLKLYFTAIALLLTGIISAQEFKADVAKSKIKWTGEKLTGKHYGQIKVKSGSLTLKSGNITAGNFVIDMNSITNEDVESAEYKAKLVNHLKSDDFFGTAKYPDATLVITKAGPFSNGKAEVTGNITIKGKSNPNTFTVTKNGDVYTANIVVDRSKYDVRYGSKTFFEDIGDKVIYDEFKLDIELVLAK